MAKKKTTNPTNLMAYDFLPSMSAGNNAGLYGQLAQLGRVQRAQPLVDQQITQAFFDPITTYINKAEEQVVAGMVAYNDANPDLDDSLLFDGTEEAIGSQLQENSNRFKELNRKLAYMSPNNKNYADTVSEINKLNKENVSLRDQNKKLLDIRNVIKASDISKISTGNGAAYGKMYEQIQQGIKDNFSIKDGKIIWTNPDKNGRVKEISVDSLNAEGPEMTGGAWLELHTKNLNTIGQLPANLTANRSALIVKNTFKSLGNAGVKSLLWDIQHGAEKMNSDLTFYNTEPFIQQYIRSAGKGVTPDIIEELKVKGMTYTLPGATESIGDAFSKWYQGKLNSEPKFGKGLPEKLTEETSDEGFDQLNPFASTANTNLFVDGKRFYKTFQTRNDERRNIINIVNGKGGSRFVGAYGDYTWNPQENIWKIGDQELSTEQVMKDEGIFYSGANFENSLFEQQKQESFTKQLAISDFSDMTGGVTDVFNAINTAFKNKNAMTAGQDLKIERGGLGDNTITLTGPDGNKRKFKFNTTGGFMLDSRDSRKKDKGQLVLEDLIKTVNSFLDFDPLNPNN